MKTDAMTLNYANEITTIAPEDEKAIFAGTHLSIDSWSTVEKSPVRIENGSIVCSYERMAHNKFYTVELDNHLILVRRNKDGTIDLFELVE